MTDLEIANNYKMLDIKKVAKKLDIKEENLEMYGNYKAKIDITNYNPKGKLVLVTSINPTPFGEGKTTVAIGLNDALRKLKVNSVACLREPSLGPVFGTKGGATGGGYAQVMPSVDINLHFTGDMHAITSANNLLCAVIDNHIYQGNSLDINPDTITFNRCLDMNDRALREISIPGRKENFNITAASEIMTLFCLAKDFDDLKRRINNIIIGYNSKEKPIYVSDLKCADAMAILLKDAFKPNLVQSLEGNPVIIHGGPFANIAHGCNSLVATKLGLTLSDYVVTEAGFGADLGAEKFFDIVCRNNIKPNCVVINFTLKALKHNGGATKEIITAPSIKYIREGIINLQIHIKNVQKYTNNIVVCLNKFDTDTKEEIEFVENFIKDLGVEFAICDSFKNGSTGSLDLAKKVIEVSNNKVDFKYLYDLKDSIEDKISKICTEIYGADKVIFTKKAKDTIDDIESLGYSYLPICIAKTQYSLTDNKDVLGYPRKYSITVDKIKLQTGAGFIIIYLGDIMTMPGLSKKPAYEKMSIDKGIIKGIY